MTTTLAEAQGFPAMQFHELDPVAPKAKAGSIMTQRMTPSLFFDNDPLYFGTDRIIKWAGGTVAYATSVKSVPAVLSSKRDHGLENYPDFYTVNSAEAGSSWSSRLPAQYS